MFKDAIIRDLSVVTLIKIVLILAIYYACFAAYDGHPVDTASHLLGPAPASSPHQG